MVMYPTFTIKNAVSFWFLSLWPTFSSYPWYFIIWYCISWNFLSVLLAYPLVYIFLYCPVHFFPTSGKCNNSVCIGRELEKWSANWTAWQYDNRWGYQVSSKVTHKCQLFCLFSDNEYFPVKPHLSQVLWNSVMKRISHCMTCCLHSLSWFCCCLIVSHP